MTSKLTTPYFRLFIISIFLTGVFTYAYVSKKSLFNFLSDESSFLVKTFPHFTFHNIKTDQQENSHEIIDATGKPLVVHFWATWCAPCEEEFPSLVNLIEKFQDKDIVFLLLAPFDEIPKMKKFIKRYKLPQEKVVLGLDKEGLIMKKFGLLKVPETFVFDRDRVLVHKYIGPQNWDHEYFHKKIDSVLL